MTKSFSIWLGFDSRESAAFAVAGQSIRNHLSRPVPINGVVLWYLQKHGLYTRPTEMRQSALDRPIMWDVISDAPMSTEFAISRFLVPHLARWSALKSQSPQCSWALFMDCDVMARADVCELLDLANDRYAVMCVKHQHVPTEATKMDGQVQTTYARKNWSSVMMFNLHHSANSSLTPALVNSLPGRDLHRFCWLDDDEIGDLPPEWNWLPNHSDPDCEPKLVHWTQGWPGMDGYEDAPYADEWRSFHYRWGLKVA